METNKILIDYVRNQEEKIADMKERVRLLNIAIPETEATLRADKQKWGIE